MTDGDAQRTGEPPREQGSAGVGPAPAHDVVEPDRDVVEPDLASAEPAPEPVASTASADRPRRRGDRTPHGENAYSPDSLLRALTSNPLDVAALHPVETTSAEASPPDTPAMRVFTVALSVVLGLAVAVAVVNLRASATGEDSPRAALSTQVRESQERADRLLAEQTRKEAELRALQAPALADGDAAAVDRVAQYETLDGAVALRGKGIRLTLEDSAPLPPAPGATEGAVNRVTDEDLQIAVNGLWAAGAEAIAVNGARLTATSAIRTAGQAVLVDFRPLSPPYVISAIGDPTALETAARTGDPGTYLQELSRRYGIRSDVAHAADIELAARSRKPLREARPPQEPTREPAPGQRPDTNDEEENG